MKKLVKLFVVLCLVFYTNISFSGDDSTNIPIGSIEISIEKLYINYNVDSHKTVRNLLVPKCVRDTSVIGTNPGRKFPGFNRSDSLGASDTNIVDWVPVRIINASDSSKYYWLAGVLTTDNRVVRPNDPEKRNLCFYHVNPGYYYIEINHGKSIPIYSATPYLINGVEPVIHTFWNKPEYVYQSGFKKSIFPWLTRSMPLKYYEYDIWGVFQGDINGDHWIDLWDWIIIVNHISNVIRYTRPDVDGNNLVNQKDVDIMVDNWWTTTQSPFITEQRWIEPIGPDNFIFSNTLIPYGLYAKEFVRDSANVISFNICLKIDSRFSVGQFVIYFDTLSLNSGNASISIIDPITQVANGSIYRNELRILMLQLDGIEISGEKKLCRVKLRTSSSSFIGNCSFTWRNSGPAATQIAILRNDSLLSITDSNNHFVQNNLPVDIHNVTQIPIQYSLSQNYPNPFNPSTTIRYQLSTDSKVDLMIYDITGREVRRVLNEQKSAGYYSVDLDGSSLSSGIYFYKLTAGSFIETKKMILIK